jgi:hypothetical protein
MSLILEKKLNDAELKDLGIELSLSSLNGTLTQKRYDELVRILLEDETMGDVIMGVILTGRPEWRVKHINFYSA